MKIHLNGHLDVPQERWESVMQALPEHIALTHAEEGCISFEVVPSEQIRNRLMVAEVFKDRASFDAHQTRTKASPWFEITTGIPREYEITEVE
ncbi:MAG: antibiotic biosynthesis monooxygenase [Lentilitoribacter sp.]